MAVGTQRQIAEQRAKNEQLRFEQENFWSRKIFLGTVYFSAGNLVKFTSSTILYIWQSNCCWHIRRETQVHRQLVSDSITDLLNYVDQHMKVKKKVDRTRWLSPLWVDVLSNSRKLYIYTLCPYQLLSYWQQCIGSFSTITLERTLLAISKVSSQQSGIRRAKIVRESVLYLLRHHCKNKNPSISFNWPSMA